MGDNDGQGEFLNPDDPLYKESQYLKEQVEQLFKKLSGEDPVVSNDDKLKYLRIINFNFATLQRLMQALYIRQGLVEDGVADLHERLNKPLEKLESFLEANERRDRVVERHPERLPVSRGHGCLITLIGLQVFSTCRIWTR